MTQQHISDKGDLKKYRFETPNLIDDMGLTPYERALYTHYKRVCGANGGQCTESVRTTSAKTKMAIGQVPTARDALEAKGLITKQKNAKGIIISVIDIWPVNFRYYSIKDRPDIDGWTISQIEGWLNRSPDERSPDEQSNRSLSEQDCSPDETKKEPCKKELIQEEEDLGQSLKEISQHYQDSGFGMLSMITAQMLEDDLKAYPRDWIIEAMRRAVEANVRRWSYVRGILKNWLAIGGPQNDRPAENGENNGRNQSSSKNHRHKNKGRQKRTQPGGNARGVAAAFKALS